jgi:hypothetical protein
MILTLALLAALVAAPEPVSAPGQPVVTREVRMASLTIPDEIAPAVLPYLDCLQARIDMRVYSEGKLVPPPPGVTEGSDCRPTREHARQDADTMLKRLGGRGRGERAAFIERTLTSMDEFTKLPAFPLAPPPPAPPAPPTE